MYKDPSFMGIGSAACEDDPSSAELCVVCVSMIFFYRIIQLAAANKQCRLGEVVSRCRASCGYCSTPLVNTMWTTAKRTCVSKRRKIENSFCA
jgi:hypothetical protein